MLAGESVGSVVASSLTAYLCNHAGWPWAFYVPGTFITCVGLCQLLCVTSDPKNHCLVSMAEYIYIQTHIDGSSIKRDHTNENGNQLKITEGPDECATKFRPFPWGEVFSSGIVWIIFYVRFVNSLIANMILLKFPACMRDVLGMPVLRIGYYSAAILALSGAR